MQSLCAGEQLLQQVGEGGKLIVACEAGGSLVPNPSFVTGKESRSLKVGVKVLWTSPVIFEACDVYDGFSSTALPVPEESLTLVQAAYKAVVAKRYSDIKHLNGGVYGEYLFAL